jgi:excisionase family DNA binding protein
MGRWTGWGRAEKVDHDEIDDALIERIARRAAELVRQWNGSADADPWLRGADRIAAYIDCSRSRVYALVSARRIPIHHDGSALIARRSELDRWLRAGGGRRP